MPHISKRKEGTWQQTPLRRPAAMCLLPWQSECITGGGQCQTSAPHGCALLEFFVALGYHVAGTVGKWMPPPDPVALMQSKVEDGELMQVVLLKDVKRLGKAGEVRNVADGYARNYLIPNGLATPASAGAVREAQEHANMQARRAAREEEQARSIAEALNGLTLNLKAKAGETGHLYGSITASDIVAAIEGKTGQAVDRRKLVMEEPIRDLGSFEVPVRFTGDITATIHVNVEAE